MGLWTLHTFLLVLPLCRADILEFPAFYGGDLWRDKFITLDRFLDAEVIEEIQNTVSDAPRFTVLAPDLMRTNTEVNLYLQADDMSSPVLVQITIQDYRKSITLLQDSVTLNSGNSFYTLKPIKLSSSHFDHEEKKDNYVYLKVNFQGFHIEERMIMVSLQTGYIFIQTDKPVYNPGNIVHFRTFVSSPYFKAIDESITIEVQNSEGLVVKQLLRYRAVDAIYSDIFTLSEFANEGTWKVTAKFDNWQQNTFSTQFQVKKFVLPAFNVTLIPRKTSISLEDSQLEVEVEARYLYGKPVKGTAYVLFGVQINNERARLPTMKRVTDLSGGVATLSIEELKSAFPDTSVLVGNSVYVKASVVTESGGDLVEAEKRGIKIVASPYVISFKDTPKYFKPGLPFDLRVQVTHHDGSPAQEVPVKVNLLDSLLVVSHGSTTAIINMPDNGNQQTIIAETTQAGLRPDQQARHQMTIQAYKPFNQHKQNYLYISLGSDRVTLGGGLSLKLTIKAADLTYRSFITKITYLVVSKGQIILAKRVDVADHVVTSVPLTVTGEMMPSFRFVAFYSIPWAGMEEVVSDSIWVDVEDSCVGGLKVGPGTDSVQHYRPGEGFNFQVRGDPGSKVSLVAVDNSIYLLNKDRLTQNKLWDVVEQGDFGCTHGAGSEAGSVFTDAGLLYVSSAGFKTNLRQTLQCPGSIRSRRSAELLQRKAKLESHYRQELQRRCCRDGLREIPMSYSCTRRSLYITEGWECMRAFRHCCSVYRDEVFDTARPTTPPPTTTPEPFVHVFARLHPHVNCKPHSVVNRRFHSPGIVAQGGIGRIEMNLRTEAMAMPGLPGPVGVPGLAGMPGRPGLGSPQWEYIDEEDVYLRSKFYESWLWNEFKLPNKQEEDGFALKNVVNTLPDSITEWGILAISASPKTGFCVAEPYNIRSFQSFFVDLKLPHSVARNEQVEIKAVIQNYGASNLRVRVVLMKTQDICSVAFKGRHTQEVVVPASSSIAVPYTIVPLVVGKLPLEVMVLAGDIFGSDRVQKTLRVVLEGVQKTKVFSEVLNPSAAGGTQIVRIGKIEVDSIVPRSVPETIINVRGNVLADSIDNSISDDSLASLIQMPGGCVEQNVARMTLPLIAALYLERTYDWAKVGVQRRDEAIGYIKRGYENQLQYQRKDGSYPPYKGEGGSTWVTAYVVKVYSMADSFISITNKHVCDPLNYLVKNKHRAGQGNFIEENPVYSTTITGGLKGDDPETTLTAFVLIALAEAKQANIRCGSSGADVEAVIRRTAEYLKRSLLVPGRRPYTVAIASYALALLGETRPYDPTQALLRAAAPGGSHWPDRLNTLFSLEATGYALLALVKLGHMEQAAAPFKWLNKQRGRGGGFGSTQSTMVVLQALSEYMLNRPPSRDINLDVRIRIKGRREESIRFSHDSAYVSRSTRLPAKADLEVEAEGSGQGILEVVTYYNQMHEVDEKQRCKHFDLHVTIEEATDKPTPDVEKFYQMTIKVRALGANDVRMVVLDVSLPSGFSPENSDLEKLSNSVDHYINNFQVVDNLSDRGSLIIHLFKVSHREPEILMFRLQQRFKVGLLQLSPVTVYEYYTPDHRCTRTYNPNVNYEDLSRICRNDVCRCTQGDCCIPKTDSENFINKDRETFACKSLHHVFKVKVLNVEQNYYDKYTMEITRVIKEGEEAGVGVGQKRLFMSHGNCREWINLTLGTEYLIIGPEIDKWIVDEETNSFSYMLGKDTWVERWPSPSECSSNLQVKCRTLEAAANELTIKSCRT